MASSFCGVGDCHNPNHVDVCLMCQKGLWREQHPKLSALYAFLFCAGIIFVPALTVMAVSNAR